MVRWVCACVMALVMCSTRAAANIVEFRWAGVMDVPAPLPGPLSFVTTGDIYVLYYTFDTNAADQLPANPTDGQYPVIRLTLIIDGQIVETTNGRILVENRDADNRESYLIEADVPGTGGLSFGCGTLVPVGTFASDAIPAALPPSSDFIVPGAFVRNVANTQFATGSVATFQTRTTLGACCLPFGDCIQVSSLHCSAIGFAKSASSCVPTYRGDGTVCGQVDCAEGRGSCCTVDGSCFEVEQVCCEANGGVFSGAGTRCATTNCLGACCLTAFDSASGSTITKCFDGISEALCDAAGGDEDSFYHGGGSTCATVTCVGACCLPNGGCLDTLRAACEAIPNSRFNGETTTCATVTCTGACCVSGGTCIDLSRDACLALAESVFGGIGSACATFDCPGACCLSATQRCVERTAGACASSGGVFLGVGTRCSSATCPGSCCFANGTCADNQLVNDCVAAGGEFNGAFSQCATQDCRWACCLPGVSSCTDNTLVECQAANGVYASLVKCAERTDGCPGSCCLPNTSTPCQDLTATQCAALGGIFGGEGTRCANLVEGCPGACCLFDPAQPCIETTLDQCVALSGSFGGAGSRCATVECPGACCLQNYPDYSCTFVTESACTSMGGIFHGEAVVCGVVNCKPPECVCEWENFEADKANAIVSETNVTLPDSMAADDFIVPCGKVFKTRTFCGVMVTNDLPGQNGNVFDKPSGILNFHEDCNGKPSTLIATLTDPQYTVLGNAPFGAPGQYKWVRLCFNTNNLAFSGLNGDARFWASMIGVGDHQPGERYYWATSRTAPTTQVQGVQSQLKSAWVPGFADWRDVDNGNGGCHDLSFEICGDLCDVVCDNRPYGLTGGAKILNSVFFGTKTADDFQIAPCTRADLCEIELYIATNCTPTRTKLEIYENECSTPAARIGIFATPEVIPQLGVGNVPITFTSPVSGRPLPVYCLRWKFARGTIVLPGEQNYWLSAYLDGTGIVTEEAYVLYKSDPLCHIKLTQAQFLSTPFEVNEWATIDQVEPGPRDMAFRILGVVIRDLASGTVTVPGQTEETMVGETAPLAAPAAVPIGVPGDVNLDGRTDGADVEWILRQLSAPPGPRSVPH